MQFEDIVYLLGCVIAIGVFLGRHSVSKDNHDFAWACYAGFCLVVGLIVIVLFRFVF